MFDCRRWGLVGVTRTLFSLDETYCSWPPISARDTVVSMILLWSPLTWEQEHSVSPNRATLKTGELVEMISCLIRGSLGFVEGFWILWVSSGFFGDFCVWDSLKFFGVLWGSWTHHSKNLSLEHKDKLKLIFIKGFKQLTLIEIYKIIFLDWLILSAIVFCVWSEPPRRWDWRRQM